ncbi:MAG: hypothetical protein P8J32_00505 [bacterium]|nr:hypothetical protein [bacterium]
MPWYLHAATFGITPTSFVEDVEKGDAVTGSVTLVRANPKQDEYILVTAVDDPFGAIQFTSGERIYLPMGDFEVEYTFEIDTDLLREIEMFQAGIHFASESVEEDGSGVGIVLSALIDVKLSLFDELPNEEVAEGQDDLEDSSLVTKDPRNLLAHGLLFLAIVFAVTVLFSARQIKVNPRMKVLCVLSVIAAAVFGIGWMLINDFLLKYQWIDDEPINVAVLSKGAYFVVSSEEDGGGDVFLHPTAGGRQALSGAWRYVVTSTDRAYVIPQDVDALEGYGNQFFLFHETGIKLFDVDALDGAIVSVQENIIGSYALFSGEGSEGETFWCVSEVWEKLHIQCDYLNHYVSSEIYDAWFSDTEHNTVYLKTEETSYMFDIWSKEVIRLDEILEGESNSLASPEPLAIDGVVSRVGMVSLDGRWFFATIGSEYHALSDSLWLEKIQNESKTRVSLVDSRTQRRMFITELRSGDTLHYLQNGSLYTSP